MDAFIDSYWVQNIAVNFSGTSSAEKDEYSYRKTLEKLAILAAQNGHIRINFYQTGFEPIAIGFYRALTQFLMNGHGKPVHIEVIPQHFVKDRETGKQIYIQSDPWS